MKVIINTSCKEIQNTSEETQAQLVLVQADLQKLTEAAYTSDNEDDEEEDRYGAEVQLTENHVALQVCRSLYDHLRSRLEMEVPEQKAAQQNTFQISFGSITGVAIGDNQGSIHQNLTFGQSPTSFIATPSHA